MEWFFLLFLKQRVGSAKIWRFRACTVAELHKGGFGKVVENHIMLLTDWSIAMPLVRWERHHRRQMGLSEMRQKQIRCKYWFLKKCFKASHTLKPIAFLVLNISFAIGFNQRLAQHFFCNMKKRIGQWLSALWTQKSWNMERPRQTYFARF